MYLVLFIVFHYTNRMKFAITFFVIIGFLSIAVFGFLAMGHQSGGIHSGCIATTAKALGVCPNANGASAAAFHLSVYKGFSTAILLAFAAELLLIMAVMSRLGASLKISAGAPFAAIFADHKRRVTTPRLIHTQIFTRWLSRLENSPATTL